MIHSAYLEKKIRITGKTRSVLLEESLLIHCNLCKRPIACKLCGKHSVDFGLYDMIGIVGVQYDETNYHPAWTLGITFGLWWLFLCLFPHVRGIDCAGDAISLLVLELSTIAITRGCCITTYVHSLHRMYSLPTS